MDTATPVTGVAVGSEAGTLAEVAVRHERRHAEVLVPAVRWVLEQAEVDPGALAGVAVGTGRGCSPACGSGSPRPRRWPRRGLPMVAVPSLDLIAFARHDPPGHLPGDRRPPGRGVLRPVPPRPRRGGARVTDYQVLRPTSSPPGSRPGRKVLLCGDGALLYREAFEHLGEPVPDRGADPSSPSAAALVELALPQMLREEFTSPLDVTPCTCAVPTSIAWASFAAAGGSGASSAAPDRDGAA